MAQLNNGNYDALAWVQNEVQQSLADALQILTRFIDAPEDAASIEPCVTQLHQVTGIMEMLNLQGALLLSQEMLASATVIRSNAGTDTTQIQDSLLKGLLLLPNYLNQIGPEIEDHPLRLIDTINELRLRRDEKAITANSLFKPSLSVVLPSDVLPKPHDTTTKSAVSLDKVGHAFQVSLLSWIKNNDNDSLNKLSQLVHYLRMSCTHERNILLWWVAEGVIEAINDDGLAVDTKTKLSLGKLNDPIKSLTKHDEQYLLSLFPTDIVHQLLLLIAQSTSSGPHVSQIKEIFGLDFYDQQIHQKIYSFTDNALTEARAGILEQLLEAKEQLSQFDREDSNATTVIEQITTQFSSLASALDLIAEETASQLLHQHQETLSNTLSQDELPSDSQLMALADDLLRIENQLQQANHVSSLQNSSEDLQSAVIDECLNELANIKETLILVENKRVNSDDVIPDTAAQIALIAGSTSMLNLDDTTQLLEGTAVKMTHRHDSQDNFTDNEFGLLAEIIAATELYLEGLSQHGQHQTQFLTQAQHQLDHFEALARGDVITDKTENDVPSSQVTQTETSVDRYIELQQLVTSSFAEEDVSLELEETPQETTAAPQRETSVDQYIQRLEDTPAPQQETSVDRYLQQLENTPAPQQETSVDQYIQQLEDTPAPQQETSVDQYIQQLEDTPVPQQETSVDRYIQQLEDTPVPQQETSVERYIQQLEDAPAPQQETSVERYIQQLEDTPEYFEEQPLELVINDFPETNIEPQFAEGIDPDIAEVFIEEADEVLAELDILIPSWKTTNNDEDLATIRRHFHTLKGSGRMAGAEVIGKLAWSVEDLLNRTLDNQVDTSSTVQDFVSSSHQLIPALVTRFTQGDMSEDNEADALQTAINNLISSETENNQTTDHELRQIFRDEVSDHISAFKDHLTDATAPFDINEAIIQITHSIKGCAAIAEISAISDVSIALDDKLRQFYQQNVALNEVQLDTFNKGLNDFESLIDEALEERENPSQVDTLLTLINDLTVEPASQGHLTHRIDPETLSVFLEETDELLEQYQLLRQQLQQLPEDEDYKSAIKHTLAKLSETATYAEVNELTEAYQSLSQLSAQADISDPTVSSLLETGSAQVNNIVEDLRNNREPSDAEDFTAQVEHYFDTLHTLRLATPDIVETNNEIIDSGPFIIPETDDDLLEAFTEECAELLESSGNAIKQWQQNPEDDEAALQLQRDLHTLKGGSRLTAITPIADLTHHTESLAIMAGDNQCDTDDAFFKLLQRCQDRLADMHDQLNQRDNIMLANDLIAEIEQFNGEPEPDSPEIDVTQLIPTISAPVEVEQMASANKPTSGNNEQVRVKAELLDFLTNFAGEVNISRDRVSQQNTAMRQQLSEMESTVERLQDQLRKLEMETEAQILFRYEDTESQNRSEFDPLELDRFSQMQQLSRGLTESVTDLHDITRSIEGLVIESDTILIQQSRLSTDLQQGLMNTRLLPFSGLVPRFERIVRQTNDELGKQSELTVYGADRELDRTILDHIVAPIEHILRNAISHGIESEEERKQAGKDEVANLTLTITRDGSEILITLSDDGKGIDVEKIREKALTKNLINPDKMPSDDELIQLILHSGFSTADDISQLAGRGVGMDVVNSEIRTLKGRLSIQSVPGQGSSFNIRLPLTLSVMQALLIGCADDQYAVPLASVHAGERISIKDVKELLTQGDEARYEFNGTYYKFMALASLLNQPFRLQDEHAPQLPLLLFNSGEVQVALVVDSINSSREIVLKSVGEQLGHIEAINGATILGDGQVVFVLDIPTLVNTVDKTIAADNLLNSAISTLESIRNRLPVAMVVDDSITMRKASGNLLKRHGFEVITARDGIDAVALLNEQVPDVILLDVEMPRMDGFEFATLVRNDEQFSDIPIIMITSRTGDKHRTRARNIGVNAYLGKPYQEGELVDTLQNLLGAKYPDHD
jgi:chemosensory pili system protein ChpA (sensor histidine kinase/response regulator)